MAKKIAIVIRKGGSGKTTTATNLAAGLNEKGHKVLLVDLDSQSNATSGVGIDYRTVPNSINQVIAGDIQDVHTAIYENHFGLHVLPGSPELVKTENGMNGRPDSLWRLREVLDSIDNEYEFVVIDTPPNEGALTYSALLAANTAIVPVSAESWTDGGLEGAMQMIGRVQQHSNQQLSVDGILFTKTDRTQFKDSLYEDTNDAYKGLVYAFDIPRGTHVNQANTLGNPIVRFFPSHPAAVEYFKLVERIRQNG